MENLPPVCVRMIIAVACDVFLAKASISETCIYRLMPMHHLTDHGIVIRHRNVVARSI